MATSKKKQSKKSAASGEQPAKPSGKQPAKTRRKQPAKPSGKLKKPGLTTQDRDALLKLEPSYADPINRSVAEILQESRELEAAFRKYTAEIYAKSRLDKKVGQSIGARRDLLEAAEAAWSVHRDGTSTQAFRELRREAEALKRDAMAALRYFLRGESDVEGRLDAIAEGTGLADLVLDLTRLADLLDERKEHLTKADLPKKPGARARELAKALGGGAAEAAANDEGARAMGLRNRAFWWLREAMDEVSAAGRYVFRNDPKKLSLFWPSASRGGRRKGSAPSGGAPEGAAEKSAVKKPEGTGGPA